MPLQRLVPMLLAALVSMLGGIAAASPSPALAAAPVVEDPAEPLVDKIRPVGPARQPDKPAGRDVDGAIGLLVQDGPDYLGAGSRSTSARPVGYVRWGRYTLSGSGGLITRRNETLDGGLGAVVHVTDGLRFALGLRNDSGRRDDDAPWLAGMGEIPRTVQGRFSVRWQPSAVLQARLALTADLSGRVAGSLVDASVSRSWPLGARSDLSLSVGFSAATRSYMRTWHGVTPAQSQTSGLPEYAPDAGLRDARIGLTWRGELSPRWGAFAGMTASRVIGPAARSPLTLQQDGVTASSGVYWRF